jgi:ADP-L-glycero-D-manno-heptose 6-epimerase
LKLFEGSDKFFRDFICVDDVVKIVIGNEENSGIYDLGTNAPVSFQHVAECVINKYGGEIDYIPFPTHLVGKYQDYTCAKSQWTGHKFITVKEYLS